MYVLCLFMWDACKYVCMYVYMYVCMYVYMYVCLSVCMYVHACMHACMQAWDRPLPDVIAARRGLDLVEVCFVSDGLLFFQGPYGAHPGLNVVVFLIRGG